MNGEMHCMITFPFPCRTAIWKTVAPVLLAFLDSKSIRCLLVFAIRPSMTVNWCESQISQAKCIGEKPLSFSVHTRSSTCSMPSIREMNLHISTRLALLIPMWSMDSPLYFALSRANLRFLGCSTPLSCARFPICVRWCISAMVGILELERQLTGVVSGVYPVKLLTSCAERKNMLFEC